jgi:hypothetical protein
MLGGGKPQAAPTRHPRIAGLAAATRRFRDMMLSSRKRLDLAAAGQHDTLAKAGLAGTNRNRTIITTSHLGHNCYWERLAMGK